MSLSEGVTGTVSPSWMVTSTASTSRSSAYIRAGEDCQWIFDPVGTIYDTKSDWVESSNAKACEHGFRLYVGEGRALKTKKPSASSGRLELACWKYRGKDAQGRRTRAGGCRFKLKGREFSDADGTVRWQLVGGVFNHSHDCDSAPLPTRMATGSKKRKTKVENDGHKSSESTSPQADQSPAPSNASPLFSAPQPFKTQHHGGAEGQVFAGRCAIPPTVPLWIPPLSVPSLPTRGQSFDSYSPYHFGLSTNAHHNAPSPSSYLLRAVHTSAQQQAQPMWYAPPATLRPADLDSNIASPLSHFAPSPLTTASSPVSMVDTPSSLVSSTASTTPASSVVSSSSALSRHSISALLVKTHPELEQYTDAWIATGVDLDQIKSWTDLEVHRFIDEDLVHLCPALAHRYFHKFLLHLFLAQMKAERTVSAHSEHQRDTWEAHPYSTSGSHWQATADLSLPCQPQGPLMHDFLSMSAPSEYGSSFSSMYQPSIKPEPH